MLIEFNFTLNRTTSNEANAWSEVTQIAAKQISYLRELNLVLLYGDTELTKKSYRMQSSNDEGLLNKLKKVYRLSLLFNK